MPFEKKIIAVTDTETCGLGNKMLTYDLAYVIADKQGNVLAENHGLIEEIFTDPKQMKSAYYSGKTFSHYAPMLDRGEIRLKPWAQMQAEFVADCEAHGVNVFAAYNASFDIRAIGLTNRVLGAEGKFLPYKMDTLCIWRFACETIFQSANYYALAQQQGWKSEAGNFVTNAECAYRYLKPEWDFVEDHTALSDARIENVILEKCFSRKKKVPYNVGSGGAWQIAQPKGDR